MSEKCHFLVLYCQGFGLIFSMFAAGRVRFVKMVLDGQKPPYVPWSFKFTQEPKEQLQKYYGVEDLDVVLGNHVLQLGSDIGFFEYLGNDLYQDVFKVVWDRSIDKDIGDVKSIVLPEPTLERYTFPDPLDPRFFANIESEITAKPDMFPYRTESQYP